MRLSPTGLAHWARPYAGRIKRSALAKRRQLSPFERPTSWRGPTEHSAAATRHFMLGIALERSGRTVAAIDQYSAACELDDRFVGRWIRLADALRRAGRLDEATEAYRFAVDLAPTQPIATLWLAALSLRGVVTISADTTIADVVSELFARQVDHNAQSRFFFGLASEGAGDDNQAREQFIAALDAEPDHPDRQLHLARFEASHERWESAAQAYQQATRGLDTDAAAIEAAASTNAPPDLRGVIGRAPDPDHWASVAVLARTQIEADPSDATAHRSLGLAAFQLHMWADARDALLIATRAFPTDLVLLERLAVASMRADDLDGAIVARQRCVALSPTGSRFHRLALDLQRAGRTEEATAVFEQAIRLSGPNRRWYDQFGSALRKNADWAAAVEMCRVAVATLPDDGQLLYTLGFALEKLDQIDDAADAYRRALQLEPSRGNWWYRLGYLHERHGPPRTVVQTRTGLERRAAGDLELAVEMYQRALELEPDQASYWRRLGGVQESLGDLEAARTSYQRSVKLEPTDSTSWHLLGRSIAAGANRRGMYHTDEHDELERVWGHAVELAPHRSGSRDQLTRASIKAARWPLADKLAWFPEPSSASPSSQSTLRGYLSGDAIPIDHLESVIAAANADLMWVPREWWFPLHWKLLTDNHFTAAFRAKELMAERIVHDGAPALADNLSGYLEHARALTFLGRYELAMSALTPSLTAATPARTRQTLERQAADVSLLLGDVSAHNALLPVELDQSVAVAEQKFRSLIQGRSIAIVGPGLSDEGSGPEIDSHDVVIRTKFVRDGLEDYAQMAGSRTDISYYALGSAQYLRADIADALESNELKMAVFRTATFTLTPPHLVRPGDTRYVPSEFSAGLRSSQFAIQRIFYDIVRYQPASIKVFNIDFFLSPDAYRPGYLAEYANEAEREGFIKVLGAFGHDFLADFKFTRSMYQLGLLDGDERIKQILALSPEEYLAGLDRRR